MRFPIGIITLCLALAMAAGARTASAGPVVSLSPTETGGQLLVDIFAQVDLASPTPQYVGGFGFLLGFDPAVLSGVGVSFGASFDTDPFWSFADFSMPGVADVLGTSWWVPGEAPEVTLAAYQTSSPVHLATLTFDRLTGDDPAFSFLQGALVDANGIGFDDAEFDAAPAAVPEPASLLLFGSGLAAAAAYRRRRSS